jgi:hypothetical protein
MNEGHYRVDELAFFLVCFLDVVRGLCEVGLFLLATWDPKRCFYWGSAQCFKKIEDGPINIFKILINYSIVFLPDPIRILFYFLKLHAF